ncbi:MAG: VWA domain-containing protein [Gammaproteobacteria bacterium]|nr:VWA domain-containing protein [Gammaproteobacteria bacterium]
MAMKPELSEFLKWNDYEFLQAEWLWLIPLFIITNLLLASIKRKAVSKSGPATFADVLHKNQKLLHPLISVLSVQVKEVTHKSTSSLFYSLIFIFLAIALSQPVKVGKKLSDPPQERDIIFIVDTSVSMILRDYIINGERVDRMTLLKGVLDNFIQKLKGERMSIIVFGDHAYTLVPFTDDQYLLRRMLSRVEATMAGRFNAIGEAIALAVKESVVTNEKNPGNKKRKRILVLLTDADQPTGEIEPEIAATLAKNKNLPLYSIAIGATSFAAEESRKSGLIYSPVDLQLTRYLSEITGAKSYQAGDADALEQAIKAIDLHGTNKQEVKPLYYREDLYHWFLMTAFILFSLGQIINLLKIVSIKANNKNSQFIK